ncbi:leucyl/phenylalanyl-tRNA--protein transferase [Lysobacter oculi]|uniref:Leucyl/phenylalanyl-tRNA--protein transferase n=1 Tax=Solilutibacter oculi TaxID=2698682 RepID=A0A344J4P1_9GAMM|nr:leucyl/phenylalanyl-tRNA--protein transferase [Lysobacter oculi]AXA84001.1 leucyl/phenylalanyl-tRNA--protein transferase [Lysobacter oculi]
MSLRLPWLPADPAASFPPVESALREPDGLLCAGGDLSVPRLLNAYARGIFPWFSDGEPVLWWSPDPRMVFRSDGVRLASKFRRQLRRSHWTVRADTDFAGVIAACASAPRAGQHGTWITGDMQAAYLALHRAGHAHSVEVFDGPVPGESRLVGGIYGVAIGRMFFGESMFSGESGGSKLALAGLARFLQRHGCPLFDAQVENPHLRSVGAESMPRAAFIDIVRRQVALPGLPASWTDVFGAPPAAEFANPD